VKSLHSEELRTMDVARIAGYSVQQVRNLERDGVVPPTTRTASAYRQYGRLHLHSVLAYRALSKGVGPADAKRIIRALHQPPSPRCFHSWTRRMLSSIRSAKISDWRRLPPRRFRRNMLVKSEPDRAPPVLPAEGISMMLSTDSRAYG
jgi:DNA-binding transcriptional MerR regulator